MSESYPEAGAGEPLREVDLFVRFGLTERTSVSFPLRDLGTGDTDLDESRRTAGPDERLLRGDTLVRPDFGGDPLRKDAGDRLRDRERDLACLDPPLRLLSRAKRAPRERASEPLCGEV